MLYASERARREMIRQNMLRLHVLLFGVAACPIVPAMDLCVVCGLIEEE